jgi:hypothetical protein
VCILILPSTTPGLVVGWFCALSGTSRAASGVWGVGCRNFVGVVRDSSLCCHAATLPHHTTPRRRSLARCATKSFTIEVLLQYNVYEIVPLNFLLASPRRSHGTRYWLFSNDWLLPCPLASCLLRERTLLLPPTCQQPPNLTLTPHSDQPNTTITTPTNASHARRSITL